MIHAAQINEGKQKPKTQAKYTSDLI